MTEAQLNARRQNAQLSTGPRTPEGRKRSSLNAVRHGLTGQIIVHTKEDQEAFTKHCDGIREALAPEGALEIDLAQAIAEDRWRLNRARALENSIFALGQIDNCPEDSDNPDVDAAPKAAPGWRTPVSFSSCLFTKAASAVRWKRTRPSSAPCRGSANPPTRKRNRDVS